MHVAKRIYLNIVIFLKRNILIKNKKNIIITFFDIYIYIISIIIIYIEKKKYSYLC